MIFMCWDVSSTEYFGFSFCSTRPSNYRLYREEMVDYWMALGLTESREMNGTFEEIGTTYFNELVSRSFYEVVHAAQFFFKL